MITNLFISVFYLMGKNFSYITELNITIIFLGQEVQNLLVLCGLYLKYSPQNYSPLQILLLFFLNFIFRLQDKVRETIEALRMAGIKVWVLTGDKHETAVSVSLSCGHFHRTMNILELINQKSDSECAEQLRQLARR